MVKKYEEPIYIDLHKNSPEGDEARELEDDIRRLCEGQPFAVLATQGKGITKASLISFAASSDLTEQYVGYAPDRYRLPIHHRPQMAQDKLRLHENHPAIPVLTPERVGKIEVLSGSFLMNPVQSPVKEQAAFAVKNVRQE